jgi:Mrp family chromosome partitioning ATPase
MTGTGSPRPIVQLEAPRGEEPETFVVDAENAPFVEIGGPTGPVFSASPQNAAGEVKARPDSTSRFPRIAAPTPAAALPHGASLPKAPVDTAAYLSVRFHNAAVLSADRRAIVGPEPGLVALHHPDHPISGEYATLRDEIVKQLPAGTPRVLMFTAAVPEAGTSTVILNLGVTLARSGQRVLVADANFIRPGVAPKLGLRSTPGLLEVLGGQVPLPWVLQPTAAPNLQALPAGSLSTTDSTGVISSLGRELPRFLDQLRQWFDWVLLDAGVWGVVPERDAACPAADGVYLVTREADAERPEFTGLRTWVRHLGGGLRGYVTTRV